MTHYDNRMHNDYDMHKMICTSYITI